MNKKVKILLTLGVILLLVLIAAYLKKHDRNDAGKVNSISTVETAVGDKTFKSKISAWDAYANEKEEYYKRGSHSFMNTAGSADKVNSDPSLAENVQPTVVPSPVSRNVATRSIDDEQFDAAYEEVARNIKQIYEDAPDVQSITLSNTSASVPAVPVESDLAERRREAMMRDWGIGASKPVATQSKNFFRAVIHGTQTIKAGQTALFRTKEEIRYGDLVIPVNTLLTGWATISDNRLTISISSVRVGRDVRVIPLELYGSDGIPGLPLSYDAVGKVADAQASATATQELSSAASRYGGTIGRVAGSLISGVGNQIRNLKNVEVTLIDNQLVILKLKAEQK